MNIFINESINGPQGTLQNLRESMPRNFFTFSFFFECFVMMICPNPFYERYIITQTISENAYFQVYHLNDFLLIFMFFRLFFCYRTAINYSVYTDAYSLKIYKQYGFTAGVFFAIKVKMMMRPGWLVLYDFLSQILVMSFILRLVEFPYDEKKALDDKYVDLPLNHYLNSLWLIIMTITTVGYGDISPNTVLGRMIAVISAMWGAILISLIVVVTVKLFDLSKKEEQALSHIKMSHSAAKSIKVSIKYFIAKKKFYIEKLQS